MPTTNLHGRISAALLRGDLRGGGLLAVKEPHQVTRDPHPPRQLLYLTTSLAATTLALFKDGQQQAVIASEVLGVSDDWSCWVLRYRVKTIEHRLFVPLVGREARTVVESAREDGIGILFTSGEDDETLLEAKVPALKATAATLLRHWRADLAPTAPDRLLQTMDILLAGEDQESCPVAGQLLRVGVTVVMPEDLQHELSDLMPDFPFC